MTRAFGAMWGFGPPARAADSELIRRLDAEWLVLAQSRWLREWVRCWALSDSRLDFADGEELVEAAQRRDVVTWSERDQVLSALLERVPQEALAQRVALQVVVPGLKSLINGLRRWDVEPSDVATASSAGRASGPTKPERRTVINRIRDRVARGSPGRPISLQPAFPLTQIDKRTEEMMETFRPPQPSTRRSDPEVAPGDARTLTDVELDRQIRAGWDVWCDLLDSLLSTGGMLPSRQLATRVVSFFGDGYWRAEEARVEALRRQMASQSLGRCRSADRSRGI